MRGCVVGEWVPDVRITGGTLKGRTVKVPVRSGLRPTSARVREAVFHRLQGRLKGAHVIDVFGGSGVLSLEAWSRGAARVTCVERDPVAVRAIRDNVRKLGAVVDVRCSDARGLNGRFPKSFDLVLADPPYVDDPALWAGRLAGLVRSSGLLVLEHRAGRLAPRQVELLAVEWQRRYGDSEVTMFTTKR